MDRLGSLSEMQQRLAQWQARAAQEHAEKLASLPVGTCERCYGTKRTGGIDCPSCVPYEPFAEGTPYEFQSARFDNYDESAGSKTALAKARAFLASTERRDLYLHGGVGAGKTRLAASILNEAKRIGRWCYFARVPLMLHQLQPGKQSDDLERVLMRCDLLVLDDIGAERDQATDYTRRTLYMIYEERHDRGARTIFTSNKSLDEIAEMSDDDRLTSRIAGWADVIKVTTPDQRMARRGR